MNPPDRHAHERKLNQLESRSEQHEIEDGLDLELGRRGKDHHGIDRESQKETELEPAPNRTPAAFVAIVQGKEVGKDSSLQNDREHAEGHDRLPAREGTHRQVLLVKDQHMPRVRDTHRDHEVRSDREPEGPLHLFRAPCGMSPAKRGR
jgi:hypothetical protein